MGREWNGKRKAEKEKNKAWRSRQGRKDREGQRSSEEGKVRERKARKNQEAKGREEKTTENNGRASTKTEVANINRDLGKQNARRGRK